MWFDVPINFHYYFLIKNIDLGGLIVLYSKRIACIRDEGGGQAEFYMVKEIQLTAIFLKRLCYSI